MTATNSYHLSFRPYQRNLVQPIKMSRGVIPTREGVILRLENASGTPSYSEAVTLPYFGTETVAESLKLLRSLPSDCTKKELLSLAPGHPATQFAVEAALLQLDDRLPALVRENSCPVSMLLPSGAKALLELRQGLTKGYQTFKWKIGIAPHGDELNTLQLLLKELPSGSALRLDANGGLSVEAARLWLDACESTSVEFLEQPLAPEAVSEMLELAGEYQTPIALDESVASTKDLIRCFNAGWRGKFVVKVSRLQHLWEFLEWREEARAEIIYSSALETSVGTELGLRIALSDRNNCFALGYGVSHWFPEDGLSLHQSGPNIGLLLDNSQFSTLWERLN